MHQQLLLLRVPMCAASIQWFTHLHTCARAPTHNIFLYYKKGLSAQAAAQRIVLLLTKERSGGDSRDGAAALGDYEADVRLVKTLPATLKAAAFVWRTTVKGSGGAQVLALLTLLVSSWAVITECMFTKDVDDYAVRAKQFAQAGRDAAAAWATLYGEHAPELNSLLSGGDPSLQTILYHGWAVSAALAVQKSTLVEDFLISFDAGGGDGARSARENNADANDPAAPAVPLLPPQHGDWSIIHGLQKAGHLNGKLSLVVLSPTVHQERCSVAIDSPALTVEAWMRSLVGLEVIKLAQRKLIKPKNLGSLNSNPLLPLSHSPPPRPLHPSSFFYLYF